MLAELRMAGVALIGLGNMNALWMFYFFYLLNALGYVCAGPLPNQVLLTRWFDKSRGKAMGFALPGNRNRWFSRISDSRKFWSPQSVGIRHLQHAWCAHHRHSVSTVFFIKESPNPVAVPLRRQRWLHRSPGRLRVHFFYLLAIGSMCSIGAVGGANQHLKLFVDTRPALH